MTHSVSPEGFRNSWDFILKAGREQAATCRGFDHVLYHHINVNDDKDAALADSKKFLDLYYTANYSKERLEAWLTYGSPRDCIEHLKRFKDARLQPRHVPDFHHGRPDGAAPARDGRGAAVCVRTGRTANRGTRHSISSACCVRRKETDENAHADHLGADRRDAVHRRPPGEEADHRAVSKHRCAVRWCSRIWHVPYRATTRQPVAIHRRARAGRTAARNSPPATDARISPVAMPAPRRRTAAEGMRCILQAGSRVDLAVRDQHALRAGRRSGRSRSLRGIGFCYETNSGSGFAGISDDGLRHVLC